MPVQERNLVDEVSGWLRIYDDGSVDRSWVGPPEAKFMVDSAPAHEEFIDGVAVRDVDPKSGPRVRVYMPETRPEDDPNEKLPVILHLPGGGFCISEPDWFMYYVFYSKLAKLGRAIVVSVYLQHAPENRLPSAINEGFSALLWLTSLAQSKAHDEWITGRADFGRVFLIGDSSGGNLVHEVGAQGGKTNLSPLKLAGSIPIHPGVVRATRSRSESEMPQTPFLTLDMVDKFLNLALPIGSNKDHPITCPMGPAAPPLDGLQLPPIMYCVAEKDLFIDTQMEFYEALKKANKTVELYMSENVTHSFYLNKMAVDHDPETKAQTGKLYDAIIEFIRRH
ncbi:probable carboxylesterase 6 [Chenopodium quinoa]|uniref:Alpha/beta hydrolase fold-3 domain-containing protein n=1 Tax=Chenopodium quinoa TaxID=63459 RepID=A0A803ML81_CHEQI|nr:probable carboxylesterase 6 [Chenopodium quinoa]